MATLFAASAGLVPIGSVLIPVANAADTQAACGQQPLDVEFIFDTSGSMDTASGSGTRLGFAKQAAEGLVADLQSHGGVGTLHHVGLTRFSGTTATTPLALGTSNQATVDAAITALSSNGNTPFKAGLAAGAADLAAHAGTARAGLSVTHVIIFLSDGRPNPDGATDGSYGTGSPASNQRPTKAEVDAMKATADAVYSIGLGTGGSGVTEVDTGLMALLAKAPGSYHQVVDATDLPGLFGDIFTEIACQPGIKILKTADPTSLPVGGGDVTYTFAVSNVGNVPLQDVGVADVPDCGTISSVGGDANSNGLLDLTETWTFSCKANITASSNDTATATGTSTGPDAGTVSDKASASVTVAEATPAPATEPPATEPPATEPPATEPPATPTPTPTSTGGVEAATGTPHVTLPPTSTLDSGGSGGNGSSLPITLLALLGIILGVGLFVPTPNRARRPTNRE